MLVLFTCCWGSDLSIQAEVGKLNKDLLQPFGIRYDVWSFSVRYFISIAYWKGLISGVKMSIAVPQAIGISLRNRIGDSAGEFLVVVLWGFSIGIQWLWIALFSLVSVSGLGACLPGSVWLVWNLSQLVCLFLFLCTFLPICDFWTHSHVYTRVYLLFPCTHTGLLQTVTYALSFSFYRKLDGCWVNFDDCWVSFDTARVCIHLYF